MILIFWLSLSFSKYRLSKIHHSFPGIMLLSKSTFRTATHSAKSSFCLNLTTLTVQKSWQEPYDTLQWRRGSSGLRLLTHHPKLEWVHAITQFLVAFQTAHASGIFVSIPLVWKLDQNNALLLVGTYPLRQERRRASECIYYDIPSHENKDRKVWDPCVGHIYSKSAKDTKRENIVPSIKAGTSNLHRTCVRQFSN